MKEYGVRGSKGKLLQLWQGAENLAFTLSFTLYPYSFILTPLSLLLYPYSFILYPLSFILHPSPRIVLSIKIVNICILI